MNDVLDSLLVIIITSIVLLVIACILRVTGCVIEINDKLNKIIEIKEEM